MTCTGIYESWLQKPKTAGHLFSSTFIEQFLASSEQTEVAYWTESAKKDI
jgi:hypothetical protein